MTKQNHNIVDLSTLPPVIKGFSRTWVQCAECGWVGYYDYQPWSLSDPILTLGCNHHFSENRRALTESEVINIMVHRTREARAKAEAEAAADALRGVDLDIFTAKIETAEHIDRTWGGWMHNEGRTLLREFISDLKWERAEALKKIK